MPAKEPVKRIEDTDIFKFYDKIEELPEKPVGDGGCQLIKVKVGNRWRTDCSGSCRGGGDCKHTAGIKGETVFAECTCP